MCVCVLNFIFSDSASDQITVESVVRCNALLIGRYKVSLQEGFVLRLRNSFYWNNTKWQPQNGRVGSNVIHTHIRREMIIEIFVVCLFVW